MKTKIEWIEVVQYSIEVDGGETDHAKDLIRKKLLGEEDKREISRKVMPVLSVRQGKR